MKISALFLVFITSVASAQFVNHKLADAGVATGASVAINPKNNKALVACANGKVLFSVDGGTTWKPSSIDLTKGVAGSASVVADAKGNFFIVYSVDPDSKGKSEDAWMSQVVCRYSSDDGKTFSEPVVVASVPGKDVFGAVATTFAKKEDMIVTWTQSDGFGKESTECTTSIWTSQSGNGGKKWSKPVQLNEHDGACQGSLMLGGIGSGVAYDGKIFITWATSEQVYFDRSYDGSMWLSSDLLLGGQAGSWLPEIPGFGTINNSGVVAIDNSPSRLHGIVYYVHSDLKSGEDDSDIWLSRTTNRGDTWSSAVRINQDEPGKHQFMPRAAVDPANGFLYILYYDRRNHSDNQTDVYLAYSVDGGNQFKEKKISENSFNADLAGDNTLTDFIGLSVQKGLIVPVWTSVNNGKQEVWIAPIKHEDLIK